MHQPVVGAFFNRSVYGISSQDYLRSIQRQIILQIAQQGPCVIVGRCTGDILKDIADCLKIFIHADIEKRSEYTAKHKKNPQNVLKRKINGDRLILHGLQIGSKELILNIS